ncbi:MAG: hypothetical protein IPI27_13410, partial [Betaproteobacteria bacterium]|nr:hypothetical protein [Betaproteobacteria bacterium]
MITAFGTPTYSRPNVQGADRQNPQGAGVHGRGQRPQFTARRPTDCDAIELAGIAPVEFVRRFVIGWDLTELDVIPGGGPEPVAFDPTRG